MPKGPAVWPEPATVSISTTVRRMSAALSSISCIFLSESDIGSIIYLLVRLARIFGIYYGGAYYKPIRARGNQFFFVSGGMSVNLYYGVGKFFAQRAHQADGRRFEWFALFPYIIDPHHLDKIIKAVANIKGFRRIMSRKRKPRLDRIAALPVGLQRLQCAEVVHHYARGRSKHLSRPDLSARALKFLPACEGAQAHAQALRSFSEALPELLQSSNFFMRRAWRSSPENGVDKKSSMARFASS